MAVNTQNVTSLEKELESARTDLKDLNENIKRIYGKQDNFQKYRNFLNRRCFFNNENYQFLVKRSATWVLVGSIYLKSATT